MKKEKYTSPYLEPLVVCFEQPFMPSCCNRVDPNAPIAGSDSPTSSKDSKVQFIIFLKSNLSRMNSSQASIHVNSSWPWWHGDIEWLQWVYPDGSSNRTYTSNTPVNLSCSFMKTLWKLILPECIS